MILEKQRVGWLSARSRRPTSQVRAVLPEAWSVSRSTSAGVTTDSASSYRAIENLIATYAELVDGRDFAGIGASLADASFTRQRHRERPGGHREDAPRQADRLWARRFGRKP